MFGRFLLKLQPPLKKLLRIFSTYLIFMTNMLYIQVFLERTSTSTLLKVEANQVILKVILKNIKRSEEHTSELQSRFDLVCRLLLEKKNYRFDVFYFHIISKIYI